MKPIIAIAAISLLLSACGRSPKPLGTVMRGMTKTEVVAIVGEPSKKNIVNSTEIWDYPDSSRTVIFRKDTVYTVITSAKARLDSVNRWIGKTDDKLKEGLKKAGKTLQKAGQKIDSTGKRIGDKLN